MKSSFSAIRKASAGSPKQVPDVKFLSKLEDIRGQTFLKFRRDLVDDRVLIIKVINNVTIPLLQEGLLLCGLSGEAVVVDLSEISNMSADQRRQDTYLLDIKAILMDDHALMVVDQVDDLVQFGKRIFAPMKDEDYLDLRYWHPQIPDEYCATIRYEFPERFMNLVAPFRLSEEVWNWNWKLNASPKELSVEQIRLLYALKASLIALTLDGIIERTYGMAIERLPREHLAPKLKELLTEEMLQCLEESKSNEYGHL